MTVIAALLMLLMIMDPVGNSINFMGVLSSVPKERHSLIIIRETMIAASIQLFFLFFGKYLLNALQIGQPALTIGGAVILFLISLKMIFPTKEGLFTSDIDGEPFIVPLATPMLAGPSSLAVVLLIAASKPEQIPMFAIAVVGACFITGTIILIINYGSKYIGKRIVGAVQRLTGMILTTISIQMFLTALESYLTKFGK